MEANYCFIFYTGMRVIMVWMADGVYGLLLD